MEHYAQREASYPVLKHVVLENLRRIKNDKLEELNKVKESLVLVWTDLYYDEQVFLYDEEIIKEMADIERRTMKAKRAYDEVCERSRQKDSGLKRLHQKILSKVSNLNGLFSELYELLIIRMISRLKLPLWMLEIYIFYKSTK